MKNYKGILMKISELLKDYMPRRDLSEILLEISELLQDYFEEIKK